MKKIKWWKSPDQKKWYQIACDGQLLTCLEDSARTQKEIKRLKSLKGIEIAPATAKSLIKFNCKTNIPLRIQQKMSEAFDIKSHFDNAGDFAPDYWGAK